MSLGRLTAAVASIHNENAVSLANLNFDFTLVKLEAPPEYNILGQTISRRRKVDAEEGVLHKTARKLGALFASTLPPTEDLFRIYGTRVSEISSLPSINPRESSEGAGIFASHIGADTASIWAAVTSGSSAIAAHLLGCMLARMFTGPEAISVWVELVQKQKEVINAKQRATLYSHEQEADRVAALQDITRAELANWDASARAWLQSADEAKILQHKQTMLILNNASVPVNNEADTYTSVIKAWTSALEAMNNLAKGMPQMVQNGAALLAISSWHLYPNMIVYGGPGVEVKQKDPLFNYSAILTLGLQHLRSDNKSVYWSLPLACLQYYGDPIRTSRTAGEENSRITPKQFPYILLGCLFAGWQNLAVTNEDGLEWVQKLGTILSLVGQQKENLSSAPPSTLWYVTIHLLRSVSNFLFGIITAAEQFAYLGQTEKKTAQQLINLGRRRSGFLHPTGTALPPPIFGLLQIHVLLPVLKTDLHRVQLLRALPKSIGDFEKLIIRYTSSEEKPSVEYASMISIQNYTVKRLQDGSLKKTGNGLARHVRWLALNALQLKLCVKWSEQLSDLTRANLILAKLQDIEKGSGHYRSERNLHFGYILGHINDEPLLSQERSQTIQELLEIIRIGERRAYIESLGELCLLAAEREVKPYICSPRKDLIFSSERDFITACRDLLGKLTSEVEASGVVSITLFTGDPGTAELYYIVPLRLRSNGQRSQYQMNMSAVSPEIFKEFFHADNINADTLSKLLNPSLSRLDKSVLDELRGLQACSEMVNLYSSFPGATISALVVSYNITLAKLAVQDLSQKSGLSLAQAFACIAMFESGTCNVDPECLSEVFAMSSGNSLFVAAALLCDPYDRPNLSTVRRVVGNIGRPGITFLICPPEVKIREADPEQWMSINHNKFDGQLDDCFQNTSLHLSFTEYEFPVDSGHASRHIIDRSAILLESLISLFDGGKWVAEVDILKTASSTCDGNCRLKNWKETTLKPTSPDYQLAAVSVENWDELIESPTTGVIAVRAHKNWLARLAAMAVSRKQGYYPVILPEDPCWSCCAKVIMSLDINGIRTALIV
ncbi:hypothetical protein B0O99DRAFT_507860 [Bisporella sp. PMI_857]|nr:hypothetical protein B0O99DRAFT_507860 [Bisporella sp. PMI_857]